MIYLEANLFLDARVDYTMHYDFGIMRMNTILKIRLLFSISILCFLSGFADLNAGTLRLKELVKIYNASEFGCRVNEFEGIQNLKMRVLIRDLPVPEKSDAQETQKETIEALLTGSKPVTLSNIKDRSYFRIEADVLIDGIDLKTFLKSDENQVGENDTKTPYHSMNAPLSQTELFNVENRLEEQVDRGLFSEEKNTRDRDIDRLLNQVVDLSLLAPETPLREAIEQIRQSTAPALPVVVLWNDLRENAFLEPETPIGIGGITEIRTGQAIELILRSVSIFSDEKPIIYVEGTIVTIGTIHTLKPKLINEVYPVEILAQPRLFIDEQGSGFGL